MQGALPPLWGLGFEWGKIAAGGASVMLPVLVFTALMRRYLVSGLTAGGVKE
ncbi:MAG TPA: hypothetical protein VND87_07665 [Stellaceae bacterium]|nr:hypothetical protein [Stellaceae bacterium]